MKRKEIVLSVAIISSVLVAGGGWFLWRYYRVPTITTLNGEVVADLSVAEVGDLAGSESIGMRRKYLTYLDQYQEMVYEPVPPQPSGGGADPLMERLAALSIETLKRDPRNVDALEMLPPDAMQALAAQVALRMRRCSGLPLSEYEAGLPQSGQIGLPENRNMLQHVIETYGVDAQVPPPAADSEAIRSLFQKFYTVPATFDNGASLLTDFCVDEQGFRCAVASVPAAEESDAVLYDRLSDEEMAFLSGGMAQGHLIFNVSPHVDDPRDPANRDREVVRAEFCFVVKNKSDDYYPLWMRFRYDPERETWWLTEAVRTVSVRAIVTPVFSF